MPRCLNHWSGALVSRPLENHKLGLWPRPLPWLCFAVVTARKAASGSCCTSVQIGNVPLAPILKLKVVGMEPLVIGKSRTICILRAIQAAATHLSVRDS